MERKLLRLKWLLRRLLDWFGRPIWRVAYEQLRFKPIIDDVQMALQRRWAEDVIGSVKLVDEGHVATYPVESNSPRHLLQRWVFDDAHLVHLRNVHVMAESGLAVHPGHELLFINSVGSMKNAFGYKRAMRRLYRAMRADGRHQTHEAIAVANAENWFHFAFEDLPGILNAMEAGLRPTIVMAGPELRSISEFLTKLDLPILRFPRGSVVQCRNYYFRTHETEPEFVRASVAQAVRRFGLAAYAPAASSGTREQAPQERVYISRSRSPRRSMLRELELEKELRGLGFSIVYFEDLDMEQHIAQMRDAQIVVGPHGAGLTHLLWAAPQCRVIELVPSAPPGTNHCYSSLAHGLGFPYLRIRCNPTHDHRVGEIPVTAVLSAVQSLWP
jgi:hypothetical protein